LRVYVGNLPDVCDENDICNFIYKSLTLAGGVIEQGNPVKNTLPLLRNYAYATLAHTPPLPTS